MSGGLDMDYTHEFDLYINWLLEEAEQEARQKFDIDEIALVDQDEANRRLFYNRALTLQEIQKVVEKRLWERFPKELKYSDYNVFPRRWMVKDKQINSNLQKYPLICEILNYIYNLNRYDGCWIAKENKYSYDKHPASYFITSSKFYNELVKRVGCGQRTATRYIKLLLDYGLLQHKQTLFHNQQIIIDGYFIEWNGKYKKIPLIQENKFFRDVFRTLSLKNTVGLEANCKGQQGDVSS